jgi:hypothetical protein
VNLRQLGCYATIAVKIATWKIAKARLESSLAALRAGLVMLESRKNPRRPLELEAVSNAATLEEKKSLPTTLEPT